MDRLHNIHDREGFTPELLNERMCHILRQPLSIDGKVTAKETYTHEGIKGYEIQVVRDLNTVVVEFLDDDGVAVEIKIGVKKEEYSLETFQVNEGHREITFELFCFQYLVEIIQYLNSIRRESRKLSLTTQKISEIFFAQLVGFVAKGEIDEKTIKVLLSESEHQATLVSDRVNLEVQLVLDVDSPDPLDIRGIEKKVMQLLQA